MKTGKIHLFVYILMAVAVINVYAQNQLPEPEDKPLLIANPNPALSGVNELHVQIIKTFVTEDRTGVNWDKLQLAIEKKLRQEDINCVEPKLSSVPCVKVYVHFLEVPKSQQFVFYIQTSFSRLMTLKESQKTDILVDVWKTDPVMQIMSAENIHTKMTDVILEQIETFIQAYKTANIRKFRIPDAVADQNEPLKELIQPVQLAAEESMSQYRFVASKNSSVFHKPDCRWAQNISQDNLVTYNSREEAIQAGKRPCKLCNP
jgi:hypothetical protein